MSGEQGKIALAESLAIVVVATKSIDDASKPTHSYVAIAGTHHKSSLAGESPAVCALIVFALHQLAGLKL